MIRQLAWGLSGWMLCLVSLASAPQVCAADGVSGDARHSGSGQWTIVATYPIPEGASGLAYDGTYLYCGIYGPNGDHIYQIDPDTGATVLLFTGPQEDAYGLTYDGQYLWTTDHPGSSSAPALAMQLDWDGSLIDQIELPDHYMSGIAYDGGDFWVVRYYPDPGHLYKVTGVGTIVDEFDGPDDQPWDLCLESGYLWMADYWGDVLYKLDPVTGGVVESHPSEGVDPAGVVWDGAYLWYCDNGEGGVDFLYKVDLQGEGTPQIDIPIDTHDFGLVSLGDASNWNMTVQNLGDAPLEISAVDFSPGTDLDCPATFPVVIPAAGSTTLPILYSPGAFGPLAATATIASNDPIHSELQVTLAGHGVYPEATLAVSAEAHNYGVVRVQATTRWFLELSNHGNTLLIIDDLALDDSHFYLDPAVSLPISLNALDAVEIGVWFNPQAVESYAGTLNIFSNDVGPNPAAVSLVGTGVQIDYPMGQPLWSTLIDTGFDNSLKAIASIPDVSGDGVADVIACSEDDYVRCLNGNGDGAADVLWEHEIYAGSVYSQNGLAIIEDVDDDGLSDVVVGAAWGGRLIRVISGGTGQTIWNHNTDEYGDGGWVYQVDCSHDYNGDGTVDVLATTGDDANDTGPKRVYCLNGLSGLSIWEQPLAGPGFSVIGVADFTSDGHPDVIAGASNEDETQGRVFGIDGTDGAIRWTYLVNGSSVWALAQIDDLNADGISDVMVGDFAGQIYGLNARTGGEEYTGGGYGGITRFERIEDVNGDGHSDILPAHFGTFGRLISGLTGNPIWTTPLVDKSAVVARSADVSGDGINDVIIGTLFSSNYVYWLDGVDGAVLHSQNYGTPLDAIAAIPDVVGDHSWEVVAGGRSGLVTCLSGGLQVAFEPADLNQDGQVDAADLALMLGAWGPNPGDPADLTGDGLVNAADLALLLGAWSS